jgi:hypothetical protein
VNVSIPRWGFWPKVLLAAKTYGSVFYDKSPPIDSSVEVVGAVLVPKTLAEVFGWVWLIR